MAWVCVSCGGLGSGRRRTARWLMLAWLGLAAGTAAAQGLRVTPSLSVTETLTDNRDTRAVGRQADAITQVSPGVSLSGRSGMVQGSLNYAANALLYANESSLNNVFHSLSANGGVQFIEGRLGVDAAASASRQLISALGVQSSDAALNTGNQAQVVSYSLSPYLRGIAFGDVQYNARASYQASSSDAGQLGDSSSVSLSLGLSGRVGRVGWGLDASRQQSSTAFTRRSHNDRVTGTLSSSVTPELQLSARAGWEADNLATGRADRGVTWGGALTWVPGPRTDLRADYDKRVFGNTHSVTLSHRLARTFFTLGNTRSLDRLGTAGRGVVTNFDYYYPLLSALAPAGTNKEDFVRALLVASNINPNDVAPVSLTGSLTAGATLRQQQTASVTYQGLRATFSATLNRSVSRPYGSEAEQLAATTGGRLRQRGLTLSLSHRLTPESSIALTLSQQHSSGEGAQATWTDLKSITATWTSRLGPYASVSLGARHNNFDSDVNPYQESALIGTIRMQF